MSDVDTLMSKRRLSEESRETVEAAVRAMKEIQKTEGYDNLAITGIELLLHDEYLTRDPNMLSSYARRPEIAAYIKLFIRYPK